MVHSVEALVIIMAVNNMVNRLCQLFDVWHGHRVVLHVMERHKHLQLEQARDIVCVKDHPAPIRVVILKQTFEPTDQSIVKVDAWVLLVYIFQVFRQHLRLYPYLLFHVDHGHSRFKRI